MYIDRGIYGLGFQQIGAAFRSPCPKDHSTLGFVEELLAVLLRMERTWKLQNHLLQGSVDLASRSVGFTWSYKPAKRVGLLTSPYMT